MSGARAFGWAFLEGDAASKAAIVLAFEHRGTGERTVVQAWRFARPDVVSHFGRNELLFSGFRVFVDLKPGDYRLTMVQQRGREQHALSSQDVTFAPAE